MLSEYSIWMVSHGMNGIWNIHRVGASGIQVVWYKGRSYDHM